MKKTKAKFILFVPLAVLLSACGGGGSSNEDTSGNQGDIPTVGANDAWQVIVQDDYSINENNLYVVVNQNDPTSIALGQYYIEKRKIPSSNLITVSLPVQKEITSSQAQNLAQATANATQAKAFALAWTMPYRVGPNQSITSFVADGKIADDLYPPNALCVYTPKSSYYDSGTSLVRTTPKLSSIKPAMLLASYTSFKDGIAIEPTNLANSTSQMEDYLSGIKQTIAKGIAADFKKPSGTAYYLKTSDNVRSIRASDQQYTVEKFKDYLSHQFLEKDNLGGKKDILIYQTGLAKLDPSENNTNVYLPGAIADTLTSYSGRLYDSNGQVSILSYLKAGATASYGTVREPCAIDSKFPQASILESHLLAGDTIIEAYNKSVMTPTEGLFIGEPLARPYPKMKAFYENGSMLLQNIGAATGNYNIYFEDKLIASNVYLMQGDSPKSIGKVYLSSNTSALKAVLIN